MVLHKAEKKFCTSPWIEGVLRLNGHFLPCCKSINNFGNWTEEGLAKPWNSKTAVTMRKNILEGNFPDSYCESCHNNGQSNTLRKLLLGPLSSFLQGLHKLNCERLDELAKLHQILDANKKYIDDKTRALLNTVYTTLDNLALKSDQFPWEYSDLLRRVRNIAEISEDFLVGNLHPRHVAPFRQANLIAICNARCIQCPGLYTEEISKGLSIHNRTEYIKELSREQVDKTLELEDSIIDFYANGSELLFSKDWRYIADKLRENSVKLRVSTNGMLLTEKNIKYLVDNDIVRKMNISLDAASPKLLEEIRVRVKYDRVCRNIEYLVNYCESRKYPLILSFSFCLMRRNYHELADFVDLVRHLTGNPKKTWVNIMVQPMSLKGADGYKKFLETEHHSLIDQEKLKAAFEEMLKRSKKWEIPVQVFYSYKLKDFVEKGCPMPDLMWSSHALEETA